jgi:hypothetical protein
MSYTRVGGSGWERNVNTKYTVSGNGIEMMTSLDDLAIFSHWNQKERFGFICYFHIWPNCFSISSIISLHYLFPVSPFNDPLPCICTHLTYTCRALRLYCFLFAHCRFLLTQLMCQGWVPQTRPRRVQNSVRLFFWHYLTSIPTLPIRCHICEICMSLACVNFLVLYMWNKSHTCRNASYMCLVEISLTHIYT